MKKFQPRALDSSFSEFKHSPQYEAQRDSLLDIIDNLSSAERRLVHEYGAQRALLAIRQFYGRPHKAREALEAERKLLQVQRLRSIDVSGFAARLKH